VAVGALIAAMATSAAAQTGARSQWYLQTAGLSRHGSSTQAPGRTWNEVHPGLGLEHRRVAEADPDWSTRHAGGIMQDSRAIWGGYAGAGAMRIWRLGPVAEVGLGAGAYLFYRSVSWSGRRALVPAILPTLTVGGPDSPVGLNLLYAPRASVAGRDHPSVFYAQVVIRLD
jgi:hypothetical protein